MSKKTNKFSADNFGKETAEVPQENTFYFGKKNFKWMLIGLAFFVVGFLLMLLQSLSYFIRDIAIIRGEDI